MHIEPTISPFALWGSKINKQNITNTPESARQVNLSVKHFPSTSLSFKGDCPNDSFLKAGGYNFNGSKLNYLA